MKAAIGTKTYDTESSDLLLTYNQKIQISKSSFNFEINCKVKLYKDNLGRYFKVTNNEVFESVSEEEAKQILENQMVKKV